MNIITKNILIIGTLLGVTLLGFGSAFGGETVEGRIQGLQCVVTAKLCPVDSNDPRINAEKSFVLQIGEGSYYFISNISRNELAPFVTSKARISGEELTNYNSIRANKLEVFMNGEWKTTWSQEMENARRRDLSVG